MYNNAAIEEAIFGSCQWEVGAGLGRLLWLRQCTHPGGLAPPSTHTNTTGLTNPRIVINDEQTFISVSHRFSLLLQWLSESPFVSSPTARISSSSSGQAHAKLVASRASLSLASRAPAPCTRTRTESLPMSTTQVEAKPLKSQV